MTKPSSPARKRQLTVGPKDKGQAKGKAATAKAKSAAKPGEPVASKGGRPQAKTGARLVPVILHIGGHKTGSSTVQALMNRMYSAVEAKDAAYFYPRIFDRYSGQHSDIVRLIQSGQTAELVTRLSDAVQTHSKIKNRKLVMSGEDLSAISLKEVRILRDCLKQAGLRVAKVIYFHRARESFIRSSLVQHMKGNRYYVTPSRFADRIKSYSPDEIIDRYATVFGREKIVDVELVSGSNAVELFTKASGISLPVETGGERKNKSLDFGIASWANAVNLSHDIDPGDIQMVSDQMDWPAPPAAVDFTLDEVAAHIDGNDIPALNLQKLDDKRPAEETVAYLKALSSYFGKLATAVERRSRK